MFCVRTMTTSPEAFDLGRDLVRLMLMGNGITVLAAVALWMAAGRRDWW